MRRTIGAPQFGHITLPGADGDWPSAAPYVGLGFANPDFGGLAIPRNLRSTSSWARLTAISVRPLLSVARRCLKVFASWVISNLPPEIRFARLAALAVNSASAFVCACMSAGSGAGL